MRKFVIASAATAAMIGVSLIASAQAGHAGLPRAWLDRLTRVGFGRRPFSIRGTAGAIACSIVEFS
jgi:hypothetical protein